MSRDYEHEEWIPWYTRDTAGWLELSLAARGAAEGIARKMNRNGDLHLGSRGLRGLALTLGCRWDELEPALDELLRDGPNGEPPRLVHDRERGVLHDPEALRRRRPTSTERVRAHRAKSTPPPPPMKRDETHETVSSVSKPSATNETGARVPSDLISLSSGSDLDLDVEEIPSARAREAPVSTVHHLESVVLARDAPIDDDARKVWDRLTLNRDAGRLEDVWTLFCGHFADEVFPSRNRLLGEWQKWITRQFGIAANDRERARQVAARAGPRGGPCSPLPPKPTPEQSRRFSEELFERMRAISAAGGAQ